MKFYQKWMIRAAAAGLGGLIGSVVWPATAWAESATAPGTAASGGGLSMILPDLGEFLPMLVGFIILWVILAKFAWPKILDMLDKRINTIRDNQAAAEKARLETAQLLEEQKQQLAAAKDQANQIIAAAKAAADTAKADIEAQAQAQAETMLEKARLVIAAEQQQALADLRESVADLTINLAGQLIGHDLDDAEHRQIIERYVAQAGSFNDN